MPDVKADPKPAPKADPGAELLKKYEMAEDVPDEPDPPIQPQPDVPDTVEVETPKPAAKHPSWLSRAARKAGFDDTDLSEMSTDEVKEALVLRGQDRAATGVADAVAINAAGRPYDPATGQLLPAGVVPPTAPAGTEDKPFSLKDSLGVDISGLKEDATTEEILTLVVKPLLARIDKLEAGVSEFDKREQARQMNAHFDRLDQLFAEDPDRFGKGARQRLKPGPELAKRKAVIARMGELHNEQKGIGLEEAFERATDELFGTKSAPAPKEDPNIAKFADAATIRPANRNGVKVQKGRAAAEANLATILKERASSETASEREELPD